jgi:hypothetical protein
MHNLWDLVIIGAGPAGMSAALEAVGQGLSVMVVDRQSRPGGQIFRNVGAASSALRTRLGSDYACGLPLVQKFLHSQAVFWGEANVWHVAPGRVYLSRQGESQVLLAREIIIASGGMERPVPLPGWTEPGVLGAGAADVLLKSSGLAPEGPVVLCGNGPLILQTAVHLNQLKIPVAGVVLTNSLANMVRALPKIPGVLARPGYFLHGLRMGLATTFGARCYPLARNLAIRKEEGGFAVHFTSLGKKQVLKGATVLLHDGVISETRITRLARLRHVWQQEQRYWHVATDFWGNTDVCGLRVAGDSAGVRGADAAIQSGRLVALDACRALGKITTQMRDALGAGPARTLRRLALMQPFLDRVFAPVPEHLQPADESIVCRCEELTAKDLREIIAKGSYSPDGLKSQSRSGMGTCQGRMCSAAVAEMIANAQGIPLENLPQYHAQIPLFPLRLGELANMTIPPEGL